MLEPRTRLIAFLLVVVLGIPSGSAWAACDPSDSEAVDNDCDEDGVTIAEGDCDDESDLVSPDLDESCADGLDNNCDGEVDEGCDTFPDDVQLSGGGQCAVVPFSSSVFIGFAAIAVAIRRERRC